MQLSVSVSLKSLNLKNQTPFWQMQQNLILCDWVLQLLILKVVNTEQFSRAKGKRVNFSVEVLNLRDKNGSKSSD